MISGSSWNSAYADGFDDFQSGTIIKAGGILALTFFDTLTSDAVFSQGYADSVSYSQTGTSNLGDWSAGSDTSLDKGELDLSVSYKFLQSFGLIAGNKFFTIGTNPEGYNTDYNGNTGYTPGNTSDGNSLDFQGHGATIGIIGSHSITENVSLNWNGSAVYYF